MNKFYLLIEFAIYGFLVAFVISPFVISFIRKEKVKQVILGYVEAHAQKQGTPTMGGVVFLIAISLVSFLCFSDECSLAKMSLAIFLSYGFVGFLDDFIKFKFKRNLGLRAYQKIIFQFAIAVVVGIFVYNNPKVSGELIVPFTNKTIDIGYWIIPLVALVFIATTNSVNLTDGLDGLASATTLCYLISFIALLLVFMGGANAGLFDDLEIYNLLVLMAVSVGVLLSFLVFNCFPAKVFMGDTGSLALGGLVACVAVFSKCTLYLPIFGLMFVASSVSVILQVAYYKLTKKRIFLMAPLHHHFEKKGVHEVRITMCYSIITLLIGAIVVFVSIL